MTESAAIADSAIRENLKKPNQVWFKYSEPVWVSYSGTFPGFFSYVDPAQAAWFHFWGLCEPMVKITEFIQVFSFLGPL